MNNDNGDVNDDVGVLLNSICDLCFQHHPETNDHSWFLTPQSKLQKDGIDRNFSAGKCFFLQKMPFPVEKCTFLQKNYGFQGHMSGNRRKLQEGFRAQESRNVLLCLLSRKHFCEYFFSRLPGNFALKNGGDFWWIFSGLRFPRNEARKILEKFGKNSEQNSGQNSGRKFYKFGELSVCSFSDLKNVSQVSQDDNPSRRHTSATMAGKLSKTHMFKCKKRWERYPFANQDQGESNMHQIVVTVSCRLCPPFPGQELPFSGTGKMPCFYGKSYSFYRVSCMNPLFSPTGKLGAKGDAKW